MLIENNHSTSADPADMPRKRAANNLCMLFVVMDVSVSRRTFLNGLATFFAAYQLSQIAAGGRLRECVSERRIIDVDHGEFLGTSFPTFSKEERVPHRPYMWPTCTYMSNCLISFSFSYSGISVSNTLSPVWEYLHVYLFSD